MVKYISNKIITCNDKDDPWITPEVKTSAKRNSKVYRECVNRGRNPNDEDKVHHYTNLANKLSKPQIGAKYFWTAYKKIANKKGILIAIIDDVFLSLISKRKLIYSMNILQTNVL